MKYLLLIFLQVSFLYSSAQNENLNEIDDLFKDWQRDNSPGGAISVIKNGKIIYSKEFGTSNLKTPISDSTAFRIASTSKQFTAACIHILVKKGLLDLDESLKDIFPKFPEYATDIKITHLLNHTSGIRDYLELTALKGLGREALYNEEDIMDWLINQDNLNFSPGNEYIYSNSGYWLLGKIIEKKTKMSLGKFAQKEIFAPLNMDNTLFYENNNQLISNLAIGYKVLEEGTFKTFTPPNTTVGDGGIITTINDLKKWEDEFHYKKLLKSDFWREMEKQGILNNGDTIEYASGLYVGKYKGLKTIRHNGRFFGYNSEILRFPKEQTSIIILSNRFEANTYGKANQIADILFKKKFKISEKVFHKSSRNIEPTQLFDIKQFEGTYRIEAGKLFQIKALNDSLNVYSSWSQSSFKIVWQKGNTFVYPRDTNITFTFSELQNNSTQKLTLLQYGVFSETKRTKQFSTSNVNLKDYVGTYYSKELKVNYLFKIVDGVLTVNIEGKELVLDCINSDFDIFKSGYGFILFERMNNNVIGFKLNSIRVKGINFNKK